MPLQPPPLQPLIKPNSTTAKTMKRDKHPMIKLQQQLQQHSAALKNTNSNRNNNDAICIHPQHPQIVNEDTSIVSLPTAFDQFSNETDNSSCSELTYANMNLSDHINNIESNSIINESESESIQKAKDNQTERETKKYKAFIVMNGKTKSIESENKSEAIIIENTENASDECTNANVEKEAIVIGEYQNKIVSESNDKEKQEEEEASVIDNVINEAANLCLDGINDENSFKMIGNNVIRTNKIESLIKKMESYQTNNSNPVTNKFSTYYQRNESIGGKLLKSEQIANKYIDKDVNNNDNDDNIMSPFADYAVYEDDDNNNCNVDNDDDNNKNGTDSVRVSTRTRIRTRTRSRLEQQNYKKAKKYCAPSDELTRLQIREDIRKMRNPKIDEIKLILKTIGLNQFINHHAYIHLYGNNENNDNQHNQVQFIGMNATKHKKKKKKKRKHRNYDYNYNDYDYNEYDYYGYQNQVFSISNETNINELQSQTQSKSQSHALQSQQPQSDSQPHKKKQKLNANMNHEPIKCNQCNKIFTLEVDLLLHKTNDKCSN